MRLTAYFVCSGLGTKDPSLTLRMTADEEVLANQQMLSVACER